MFFWLKDQLDFNDSAQFDAIENLGEAGFAGRHLTLGDKAVIDSIASVAGFSRKASAYYKSVSSKYTQIGGVKRSLTKVNVSPLCQSPIWSNEWTVPLRSFRTDDSVEKVLLLVEHMYDYNVIKGLAEISLRELGLAGWVKLAVTPVSGGGGGTSLTLSVHQRNKSSLGICVVDSDRPHIRGALGSTAKGCERVYEERWGWTLHVLFARELENLVPPELFEMCGVDFQGGAGNSYDEERWAIHGFIDTKKGDCLCRFEALPAADISYAETRAALAHFPWRTSAACPSSLCSLGEGNEGALISLSKALERHPLAAQRRLPSRVPPLTNLLREVVGHAAAPRWSMI